MGRVDLVLTGRIATLGDTDGFGWVEAIAVRGDRVVAAGSRAAVDALVGHTSRRLDLPPDRIAMPGLTDAHLHLGDAAVAAEGLDLSSCSTLEEGLRDVGAYVGARPGSEWILGHGWDADRWGGWPTHEDLDEVAAGRLVALWAHDHHALWVSRSALDAAGIGAGTEDPDGGIVRRTPDGYPTGVLHETAARLVSTRIPPPSLDRLVEAVERLAPQLVEAGIVAVQEPGSVIPDPDLAIAVPAYRRLAERARVPMRIDVSIRQEALETAIALGLESGAPVGPPDAGIRIGWVKLFADGTLGSRTAAMLEPFEIEVDRPAPPGDGRGIFLTPPDSLGRLAARAADAGIAAQVHAIGDRAVRVALDALEPTAGRARYRPRVEHVQLVAPDDLPRFAAAGIAASVQPVHLRTDMSAATAAWGARVERGGYPWRSLADSGALLPFGTDAPVEPWDPWPGLEVAVTRGRTGPSASGPGGGLAPDQGLDLARALRAACIDAPRSAGDRRRGPLEVGMRADVIVVPAEALAPDVEPGGALGRCRPDLVMVGGRVVVER